MANSGKPFLISIVGPTAVGKTALAISLAEKLGTEIISADSRQFYKEMTIGTAKPGKQELETVPHHFIDSHSINNLYSAGAFGRDAQKKIEFLHEDHQSVVAVGGSGLYLKALWEGFDEMPEIDPHVRSTLNDELKNNGLDSLLKELKSLDQNYYNQVDHKNGQRIVRALEVIRTTGKPFTMFRLKKKVNLPYHQLKIGLNIDRVQLFERIDRRMDAMIEKGLFEEASALYPYRNHNALQTVGYSEIMDFMDGLYDRAEAIRLLKRNSRRYAKRQLTWFGRYDDIHWFQPDQLNEIDALVNENLNG